MMTSSQGTQKVFKFHVNLEVFLTLISIVIYYVIIYRMKDQVYHKICLTEQLKQNITLRDRVLKKKNHAELMSAALATTMADPTSE